RQKQHYKSKFRAERRESQHGSVSPSGNGYLITAACMRPRTMTLGDTRLLRHRFLDCLHRAFNLPAFGRAEARETFGQEFYASLSSLRQDGRPFLRGSDHYGAAVLRIYGAAGQAS